LGASSYGGTHALARHNLGVKEARAGNMDRALMQHIMIATGFGYTRSLEHIKLMFMCGDATKDDYAKALHARLLNEECERNDDCR
jgi:hypothetical protein